MSDIDLTIAAKQPLYGDFADAAGVSQDLKKVMRDSVRWHDLNAQQRESLEMIANRIGRILSGDVNHYESWHGIAGFAELVAKAIKS